MILASDLLGMDLVGDDGESMEKSRMLLSISTMALVKYLVVDIDTADGSETRLLAVPVMVLRWDADGQLFGFTVDHATLDEAPFDSGDWPDTESVRLG
jgi:hypothetical protein